MLSACPQFAPGVWLLAPLGYATAMYPPTSQAWWPSLVGNDLLSNPSFTSYIEAGQSVSVSGPKFIQLVGGWVMGGASLLVLLLLLFVLLLVLYF